MVATSCAAEEATIHTSTPELSSVDVNLSGVVPLNVIHVLKKLKNILVNNIYNNLDLSLYIFEYFIFECCELLSTNTTIYENSGK